MVHPYGVSEPLHDARLPDGWRVAGVLPQISEAPRLTIREAVQGLIVGMSFAIFLSLASFGAGLAVAILVMRFNEPLGLRRVVRIMTARTAVMVLWILGAITALSMLLALLYEPFERVVPWVSVMIGPAALNLLLHGQQAKRDRARKQD